MVRASLPARFSALRTLSCLAILGALAACSSTAPAPVVDQTAEATQYRQHARHDYSPPGAPDDPWGPYIAESSQRFDVPERWIREVMRVESGGREFLNGDLITSPVGAMGLMQVMPTTFDEVRAEHDGIGDDPYDPHNNILAGTAYLRDMYDIYGSPGFLAAYNAGPRRLDDYLAGSKGLPDETRRYVAMIGPYIADSYPQHRSEADLMALNTIPIDIPPGLRFGGTTQYAEAAPHSASHAPARKLVARNEHERGRGHGKVELARATPQRSAGNLPVPPVEVAEYAPPRGHVGGFRIVPAAMAEPMPRHITATPAVAVGYERQAKGRSGHAAESHPSHEAAAHAAAPKGHAEKEAARTTCHAKSHCGGKS